MLTISRSQRIDWPRMVDNLRRAGMSMQQIADALEVNRRSLDNWANNGGQGEPAFWTGHALIELWCVRLRLRWVDLPTRTMTPTVSEVLRASR